MLYWEVPFSYNRVPLVYLGLKNNNLFNTLKLIDNNVYVYWE